MKYPIKARGPGICLRLITSLDLGGKGADGERFSRKRSTQTHTHPARNNRVLFAPGVGGKFSKYLKFSSPLSFKQICDKWSCVTLPERVWPPRVQLLREAAEFPGRVCREEKAGHGGRILTWVAQALPSSKKVSRRVLLPALYNGSAVNFGAKNEEARSVDRIN